MRLEVMMPADPQVQLEIAAEAFDLACELVEEDATHGSRSDQTDRYRVRREVEARMHGAQRPRRVPSIDDD